MCLIGLAYEVHPRYRLMVVANRDEFRERPTAPLHRWEEHPTILAGRDLRAGGTWLGVSETGRFAAITNYRDPREPRGGPSRGTLVGDFLAGETSAADYLAALAARGGDYSGFNLLVLDGSGLWYYGNRGPAPRRLVPGIYALSNALLDTPWPKVVRLRNGLARHLLSSPEPDGATLLGLLRDPWQPPAESLPDTGVPAEWEGLLASAFIDGRDYGTRSSTLVWLAHTQARVRELSWPGGEQREAGLRFRGREP